MSGGDAAGERGGRGGVDVEDLYSSIEHLNIDNLPHGQIIISDRDTPSSLPPSPGELLASNVRMTSQTTSGRRSPTRRQPEPMTSYSAPTTGQDRPGLDNASKSNLSKSLPNSPFFNLTELEEHGLKAREITKKLIQSLNETKDRFEKHNIVRDLGPSVEYRKKPTPSNNSEPHKRRLFQDDSPPSILRTPTSARKIGSVAFSNNVRTESADDYTDNSFNTLQQDSFSRSFLVNSENECLGIFNDDVRHCEEEFIPGLERLSDVVRSRSPERCRSPDRCWSPCRDVPLSPGAKKAWETVSDRTASNLQQERYAHVTSDDIREMEGVRNHLHKIMSDSNDGRHDTSSNRSANPISSYSSNQDSLRNCSSSTLTNQGHGSKWSLANQKSSVWTAANGSAFREKSPDRKWTDPDRTVMSRTNAEKYSDLDLDEVMMLASRITGRSRDVTRDTRSRHQGTYTDVLEMSQEPVYMEMRVLKEDIERERFRRQHCEHVIETLQRHLKDSQQQLALAFNSEKKKDIMIDQLDKTLARVVDGWKVREAEKQSSIEELKAEKKLQSEKLDQKTEMMSKFEADLQTALADLAAEQKKVAELEKFKEEEHEREHERLSNLMELQQQKLKETEKQRDELNSDLQLLKKQYADLEEVLLEERSGWQETTDDLRLKIDNLDMEFKDCLTTEKQRADDAETALEGTKQVLASVQKDLQKYQNDLDSVTRERNTLRVEMGLLEARTESSKRKLEADLNTEFEKTLAKKLSDAEQNHVRTEKDLRDNHQTIVRELTDKNQKTLDEAIQTLKEEFGKREVAYKEEIKTMEGRLENAAKEMQELRLAKQKVEAQREDLVKNLQSLMRSYSSPADDGLDEASSAGTEVESEPDRSTASHQPRPQSPLTNRSPSQFTSTSQLSAPHSPSRSRDQLHSRSQELRPYTSPASHQSYALPRSAQYPTSQSLYQLHTGPQSASERQRNIDEAFHVVQSAPPSYAASTVHGDSDSGKKRVMTSQSASQPPRVSHNNNNNGAFNKNIQHDGLSDVLSNDGLEFYYPISEPVTRYATPTQHLTANHYRSHDQMITPRVHVAPPYRTPLIIAPPMATSTELREHRKYGDHHHVTGSLLSSGYYSNTAGTRFSVGSTGEFMPLQQCNDETTTYDGSSQRSERYLTDAALTARLSPVRGHMTGSNRAPSIDSLNHSTMSLKERHSDVRDGEVSVDDVSFRSLPNGSSYRDLTEAPRSGDRQNELGHFVCKLLDRSDADSVDGSKENMPPVSHSPPQRLEHEDTKPESVDSPSGVLTPAQVAEVQRLLENYQHNNGLSDMNQSKIEELLTYLKDTKSLKSDPNTSSECLEEPNSSASRLVSVSHAPNYSSSTNAARKKLYERRNNAGTNANSSKSSGSKSTTGSQASKTNRKVAPRTGTKTPPVWR